MKLYSILLVVVMMAACGDNVVTPDPPVFPPVEPPQPPPIHAPRVDVTPDLYEIRGCTAFGMANLNEQQMTAFIYHTQAHCNMYRVGAQTDGWAGHSALYLDASAGPVVFTPEWKANIKRLYDVTSRIHGVYLQVIPTFTHKHEGYARNLKITKAVVALQQAGAPDDTRPYQHIVWEAMNEYRHPLSTLGESDVANLLRYLKTTGLPVGTDAPMRSSAGVYPERLLPLVDYVAFHPARNRMEGGGCELVRPDYNAIRKTVRRYNKPVWIDEPLAYISDDSKRRYNIERSGHYAMCGQGTEHKRKEQVRDYMWDTEHAGAVWFTHALWLFECRNMGWLPE